MVAVRTVGMKRVVIVQARMTSSRLPGKVLLDLGGRPVLAEVIRRARAMKEQDEIVVATTRLASDDPIVRLAEREGDLRLSCFPTSST